MIKFTSDELILISPISQLKNWNQQHYVDSSPEKTSFKNSEV